MKYLLVLKQYLVFKIVFRSVLIFMKCQSGVLSI
jgi:hypothetical protein